MVQNGEFPSKRQRGKNFRCLSLLKFGKCDLYPFPASPMCDSPLPFTALFLLELVFRLLDYVGVGSMRCSRGWGGELLVAPGESDRQLTEQTPLCLLSILLFLVLSSIHLHFIFFIRNGFLFSFTLPKRKKICISLYRWILFLIIISLVIGSFFHDPCLLLPFNIF